MWSSWEYHEQQEQRGNAGPPPNWSLIDELSSRNNSSSRPSTQASHHAFSRTRSNDFDYVLEKPEKPSRTNSHSTFSRSVSAYDSTSAFREALDSPYRLIDDRRQIEEDERLARLLQDQERVSVRSLPSLQPQRSSSSSVTRTSYSIVLPPVQAPPPPPPPVFITDNSSRYSSSYDSLEFGGVSVPTSVPLITFDVAKRFLLSRKSWTLGGEMYIRDEANEEIFRVKGKLLSVGAKVKIVDLRGVELAYIKQRVSIKPYYEVFKAQWLCMSLKGKKHRQLGIDNYADGSRLQIVGRHKENEYEICRGTGALSHQVAKVVVWPSEPDTYAIEICAHEDIILVLCAALIIDRINQVERW